MLHMHHNSEEESFFPQIEELAGEKGIMEANVEQHHIFHDAVENFATYVKACVDGTEQYNGKKVIEQIDLFGEALTQHLSDEIPTLQGLRKYGDKVISLPQLMEATAEKSMVSCFRRRQRGGPSRHRTRKQLTNEQKKLGLFNGLPWCMVSWDVEHEDGIWKDAPPAPWFIKFFVRHIGFWAHADWWKFAASDRQSRLRPLYAVSS